MENNNNNLEETKMSSTPLQGRIYSDVMLQSGMQKWLTLSWEAVVNFFGSWQTHKKQ